MGNQNQVTLDLQMTLFTVISLSNGRVTFQMIQDLVNGVKPEKSSASKSVDPAFASEIFEMMSANPGNKWKTGGIVERLTGMKGKQIDPAAEMKRVQIHGSVSQVLSALAKEGKILKHEAANACHTFYQVNVSAPVSEPEFLFENTHLTEDDAE